MKTSGAQARGTWHVARKWAAGSVIVGVMVASAAGTAVAAPAHRGHDRGGPHGHHGDNSGGHGHRRAVEGVVATVDPSGGFTITRGVGSVTVTVTATTVFVERGQSSATIANVVSGDRVVVVGTETTPGTLAATRVRIKAPEQASVDGVVQAVATDGSSFTITRGVTTVTVDVASTTTYATTAGASATFADVTVGDRITAKGTRGATAFDATQVVISVPPRRAILGTVAVTGPAGTSSTGTSTTTSSAGNSFTMTAGDGKRPITVDVSSTTVYFEAKVATPGFSTLATGDEVVVVGSVGDGVVDASTVVILSVPTTTTTTPTGGSSTPSS